MLAKSSGLALVPPICEHNLASGHEPGYADRFC